MPILEDAGLRVIAVSPFEVEGPDVEQAIVPVEALFPDTTCVITDFPALEYLEDEGRWHAMHHPFTSPHDDQWDLLETNPGAVVAKALGPHLPV
mgnify:CR=1 FL=1